MNERDELQEKLDLIKQRATMIEKQIKDCGKNTPVKLAGQEWLVENVSPHVKEIRKIVREFEEKLDEFDFDPED